MTAPRRPPLRRASIGPIRPVRVPLWVRAVLVALAIIIALLIVAVLIPKAQRPHFAPSGLGADWSNQSLTRAL